MKSKLGYLLYKEMTLGSTIVYTVIVVLRDGHIEEWGLICNIEVELLF